MFTLDDRTLVPGHRHKIVLCSDRVFQVPNHHLVPEYRHGRCTRILVRGLGIKGVFRLMPNENCTRSPCWGTECEHNLSHLRTRNFNLSYQSWEKLPCHNTPKQLKFVNFICYSNYSLSRRSDQRTDKINILFTSLSKHYNLILQRAFLIKKTFPTM